MINKRKETKYSCCGAELCWCGKGELILTKKDRALINYIEKHRKKDLSESNLGHADWIILILAIVIIFMGGMGTRGLF